MTAWGGGGWGRGERGEREGGRQQDDLIFLTPTTSHSLEKAGQDFEHDLESAGKTIEHGVVTVENGIVTAADDTKTWFDNAGHTIDSGLSTGWRKTSHFFKSIGL